MRHAHCDAKCDLVKQVVMAKLEREELEEELVKYKVLVSRVCASVKNR